jgi:hypothetical protein
MLLYILLFGPLVIGAIVALINSEGVNNTTEKAEAWTRKKQSNSATKKNWFTKFIINPVLWLIVKFSNWTDGFAKRGIKNGVRVALTLYLIIAWCYLIYLAVLAIIFIVITIAIIYVVFKVLINSDPDVKRGYDASQRIFGSVRRGKRVNPETGRIQEEGLIGWKDTDQRIDPDTGNLQEEGFIGWKDTGTRINQETGNIQREGFLGYEDSETRVNPETGIIQRKGFIGWEDTDERIDPNTGRHQKKGLLGWVDD